jgi:hypothetical protein
LAEVLSSEAGCAAFRVFSEREYNSENVDFWKAASSFRQIFPSDAAKIKKKVRAFLSSGV